MRKLKLSPKKLTAHQQAALVRLSSLDNYSYLHMNDGKAHLFPATLAQYESQLPTFIRIHRQHLINLDYVQEAVKTNSRQAHVTMLSGEKLPIAKRRITDVIPQLNLALNSRC